MVQFGRNSRFNQCLNLNGFLFSESLSIVSLSNCLFCCFGKTDWCSSKAPDILSEINECVPLGLTRTLPAITECVPLGFTTMLPVITECVPSVLTITFPVTTECVPSGFITTCPSAFSMHANHMGAQSSVMLRYLFIVLIICVF